MVLKQGSFEFNLFFILTIFVLIVKALLTIYLGFESYKRNKQRDEFKVDFMMSVFILMLCLFISRFLYMIFDFYLTAFDPSLYIQTPNLEIWKVASLIGSLGGVVVIFVADKRILNFRLKGIIAYILLIITIINFVYPINSKADFNLVSGLGALKLLSMLIIPAIFFYLGVKIPGLRRTAYLVGFGIIIYLIGAISVSEFILAPIRDAFKDVGQITVLFIFFISKTVGLSMASYGVTQFVAT